jgi:hypothetical protein
MNIRLVALSLAVLGAALFASSAQAQRRVASASRRVGPVRAAVSRRGGARIGSVHARNAGELFNGSAFEPYYYFDYDSEPGIIEAPPPQIILAQTVPSVSPVPNAHESLVLELQGDHWVRITNHGQSQTEGQANQPDSERASNPPSAIPPAIPRQSQAKGPPIELPPAVVVFRDGHKEEIGKYAIIGAIIYTNADYWSSGSWTRLIQIAELDVPATLKLNQERGANFRLPSGPNEVMIRP